MIKSSVIYVARTALLLISLAGLCACQTTRLTEAPLPQSKSSQSPDIKYDARTGQNYTDIDVLIYNVAALPWPIRSDRNDALELIGQGLKTARNEGAEPDIVLIQEGFRRSTKKLVEESGYPNWVRGPKTNDRTAKFSNRAPQDFIDGRRFFKGEKIGKVMGSGLYILSNFPIKSKQTQPFYAGECAGFDCGSNKGVLWAEIEVPGMPGHLQVFTTHLQSKEAAGVSNERSFTAYNLQFDAMNEFVESVFTDDHPMIFGGDFNSKNAEERLGYISEQSDRSGSRRSEIVQLAHYFCLKQPETCIAELNSDGKEPWLDTQDWQGFSPGKAVSVTPIRIIDVEDLIYENAPEIKGRKTLSDHGAFWVRYRLSWPN